MSTTQTQAFEFLLLYSFESKSLRSILLNPLVGRNFDIA